MKKIGIEIKWGLIFSIVSILWIGLERLVGLHDEYISEHFIYTNLFAVVAILLYVLALRDKRDNYYHGLMSWKQGFISGCIVSVVIFVLTPLAVYISLTYMSPIYFPNIIEYSVEAGNYSTREEAEQYFNLSSYILQSALFALVVGVITSAIVAAFVRKKPVATMS